MAEISGDPSLALATSVLGWQPIYPVLMLTALVTCSVLLRRFQARLPISPRQKVAIGIGAFCGAMIGAKLPFALSHWPQVLSPTAWFAHGKTIMAGIVGGYLGVEIAKKLMGVTVKTGDTFVVPVALAVAIGRLGCFSAGCCYGQPTDMPWGVEFALAGDAVPTLRHPTQLYEALFHAAMAVILWRLLTKSKFPGQLMKLYLIVYFVFRFVTEWLRPEPVLAFRLTAYQWSAIGLIVVFSLLWRRDVQALREGQ